MELPSTDHAPFLEARTQLQATLANITVDRATDMQLPASDSSTLLALTSQSVLDFVSTLAPILHAAIPEPAAVLPAIHPQELSQVQQRERLQTAITNLSLQLQNIQTGAYNSTKKYRPNHVNTLLSPITNVYDLTEAHTVTQVSDSALKTITAFNGEVSDSPALLQEFLRAVFDLSSTHKLTREATIRILQRKCTSVARILLDSFLENLDLKLEDSLLKVVLFLEQKYSLSWSPALARAQLAALQKSQSGTSNYCALQANILRLSHLASLDQPVATRQEFITTNQLGIFRACLSKSDQNLLLKSESTRASQSLPSHNLGSAVDELLSYHATRTAHNQARAVFDKNESMSGNPPTENAFFAPQAREPYATPRQDRQSRPPRRASEPSQRREPSRRFDKDRPRDDSRQPRNSAKRQPSRPPTVSRSKDTKQPFHTPESAGVDRGNCLRCNSNTHLMTSAACPYAGLNIPPTPCRQCPKGGIHYSRDCKKVSSHKGAPPSGKRPVSHSKTFSQPRRPQSSAAKRLHQAPDRAFVAAPLAAQALDTYFSA